jgi:hypothetical protein
MHTMRAVAIAGLVLTASCGMSSSTAGNAGDDVRVHGILTRLEQASCDAVKPDAASRVTITFDNQDGEVVGTTSTDETTLTPSSGYCAATAPYTIELPAADSYEASAPGMRSPERMTFEDLEQASFTWDLGPEIQVNE